MRLRDQEKIRKKEREKERKREADVITTADNKEIGGEENTHSELIIDAFIRTTVDRRGDA